MQLPLILPPIQSQRYDCHGCTNCCRELVVQLTAFDRDNIDRQNWAGELSTKPYIRLGRNHVLNQTPDGCCVFLSDDGKCRIHARHGPTAKPLACQLYPFTLEADAQGLRVGIRFDCPSVARNDGNPLPTHRSNIAHLASAFTEALPSAHRASESPSELVRGHPVSAKAVDLLLDLIHRWLGDTKRPLHHRVIGLHELVRTLGEARLNRFDDNRIIELARLFMSDMPALAGEQAAAPMSPPTDRQSRLLRQAVFVHCEHLSVREVGASFPKTLVYRWDQLRRARRMAAGHGAIPRLGPLEVGSDFEAFQRVEADPNLPAQPCDSLMTRYLEQRVACRTAFGPAYYGWPILDGLQSLLLAVAVIGWLARCLAVAGGRSVYGFDEIVRAVGLVDRTAGRAPGLGAASARLRLRYLTQNQGLLSLIRAYPIVP
jgi:lysine-N-methylase